MVKVRWAGRMDWLVGEWLDASFEWLNPGEACPAEFMPAGLFYRPRDKDKFCALEQTWAMWQGLA